MEHLECSTNREKNKKNNTKNLRGIGSRGFTQVVPPPGGTGVFFALPLVYFIRYKVNRKKDRTANSSRISCKSHILDSSPGCKTVVFRLLRGRYPCNSLDLQSF